MSGQITAINAYKEKRAKGILAIYSTILLLIFHSFLVLYINSSYIGQFIDSESIGSIYLIGAAFTILIFLFISYSLRRVGNYKITILFLILNFFAVIGMAFADSLRTAIPLFILHLTVLPLILFNLDVFFEAIIGNNESRTGSRRGLLLALSSFIGAVTPLLSGFLIDTGGFSLAYFLSAITLVPIFMILIFHFRHFQDPLYSEIKVFTALRSFWANYNIRFVFMSHLLLQIFFFTMVVYAPIYLSTHIGLSWSSIGIIIFAGQLAYVFFEYPIGYIADTSFGEKEMMAGGFLILAITTSWLAVINVAALLPWIVIMFLTRIGASLIEVTTESHFFKHMNGSDAQIISFFRLTRPLSFIIGAVIASISLFYLPFNILFVVIGLLMVLGIFFAFKITDTQ
ncbi:MAG: MFS transporter [Candidatus Paceibacterota bacterium]